MSGACLELLLLRMGVPPTLCQKDHRDDEEPDGRLPNYRTDRPRVRAVPRPCADRDEDESDRERLKNKDRRRRKV